MSATEAPFSALRPSIIGTQSIQNTITAARIRARLQGAVGLFCLHGVPRLRLIDTTMPERG